MPTTEERLASLEARMQRIEDLCTVVTELRAEMTGHFGIMGLELTQVHADMNRQLGEVRAEAHRDFRWIVGIQLTTMAAVIGALAGVLYGR